jgi:cation transport regulator ChaC
LDVDFEFYDPTPDDHVAVRQMLLQTYPSDAVAVGELATLLVGQSTLGTCVKVAGTDDAYSFLSVLNLREHKVHTTHTHTHTQSYPQRGRERARCTHSSVHRTQPEGMGA